MSVNKRTFNQQITWCMIFIKNDSLKSDTFFNAIFIPCFPGSIFSRVHVFQGPDFSGPGFSGSRFFRVQGFLGPGFSGSGSRVRVQVLEVALMSLLLTLNISLTDEFFSSTDYKSFVLN